MMLLKGCTQYVSTFGKLSSGYMTVKGHFSFQSQRRLMPNNVQTTTKMCSCHILAKYVLVSNLIVCATIKVLQVRIQQYMNWEPPDVQTEFRKGRGATDQIASICWIIENTRQFQKTSTSASFTTLKPLTLWITTNCEKFSKRREYQTNLSASLETYMQVNKHHWEMCMEQWTGSKLGKELKLYIVTLLERKLKSLSRVHLSMTPWTTQSMELSRQD